MHVVKEKKQVVFFQPSYTEIKVQVENLMNNNNPENTGYYFEQ